MQDTITHDEQPDWKRIAHELADPFDPDEVDFRIQGKVNEQTKKAQVLAYIDARTVQDRLDAVVGIQNWNFDWTPSGNDAKGNLMVAKGTLTIFGISKSDVGDASNFEGNKGAVSDALKRAAVHWGIGRYLYSLPATWQVTENDRISPQILKTLRAGLPLPKGYTKPAAAQKAREMPMKQGPGVLRRLPDRLVERIDELEDEGWKREEKRAEALGIAPVDFVKAKTSTYTTVARMAARLNEIEEQKFSELRLRANEIALPATEYEEMLADTGGSYAETAAKVQQWEQEHQDLKKLPVLAGR